MSKLLKRTFALALILCMVLSVIPAVSADELEITTYSFKNYTSLTQADFSTKGIYFVQKFGTVNSATKYFNVQHSAKRASWAVFVINVPETATYQILNTCVGGNYRGVGEFKLIPWTQTLEDAVTTYGSAVWAPSAITEATATFTALVDSSLAYANNNYEVAYLGQQALNAGKYFVLLRNAGYGLGGGKNLGAPASSTNGYSIADMKLIKSEDPTVAVQYALDQNAIVADNNRREYATPISCDLNVTSLVIPQRVELHLSGKKLTANSVTVAAGSYPGVLADLTGTFNTATTQAAVLSRDNGLLPMYDATIGAYTTVKPTTSVTPGANATVTNPYEVEEGTLRFGFDVTLPEAAYAYAAAEQAPVKFWFSFKVGDNDAKTVEFKNDVFDINEWITSKSVNKAFFVDLQGLDALTEETEITVTPYIQVLNVSIPCGTINHTYIPAA